MAPPFELSMLCNNKLMNISTKKASSDVNESVTDFYVYKALLANASPYFYALKNFKEGEEDVVEFKDVDPKAVGIFVYWLHTREIPKESQYRTTPVLVSAYAFGDRILAPKFKNFITDYVRSCAYVGPEWSSPRTLCYSPKTLMVLQKAGLRLSDGITRYIIDCVAYDIVVQGKSLSDSDLEEGEGGDEDQDFFRSDGDWVWLLMQRIKCVADKFRKSARSSEWDNLPRGETPLHPSFDESCRYHEATAIPDEDDAGEWAHGSHLNW